jgi:hypothetical protein
MDSIQAEGSLYRQDHWLEDRSADKAAERRTASLAGIVIVLVLLVGGLFLVQHLRTETLIEDCLMAGRQNCDILVSARH